MFKNANTLGFSLFSLIITVGIVLVLAAGTLAVINPVKRVGQAKDARRLADVTALVKAVEAYEIDNHQIPSDFSTSTLGVGEKFVLCNAEGYLTCAGQAESCLVVNDDDFLGKYLPAIPIDPDKSDSADSGYYITRQGENAIVFGSCDSYDDNGISLVAKASLPELVTTCGDGDTEGDEVCDDGNTSVEVCGDNVTQNGDYCNSDCTAVLAMSEVCDDGDTYTEQCGDGILDTAGVTFCNSDCTATYHSIETCEFYSWTNDCEIYRLGWVTDADLPVDADWCLSNCRETSGTCLGDPYTPPL